MSAQDDRWATALAEVESDARQPGLWARCFAQADGDESKAKAAYITERVASDGAHQPAAVPPSLRQLDGVCPVCRRACMLDAPACKQCGADFSPGSTYKPREREFGEVLVPDRPTPEEEAAAAPKTGSNWLLWVIGIPIALFLLVMVIGANVSPQKSAQYQQQRNIDEACDKMMADSALGAERRMTRAMCDQMKANAR